MKRLRALRLPSRLSPIALLILAILAFGLLIPRLGFYWDDWAKILVAPRFGLAGYWDYYAGDRPLSAWTHILLTPILGTSPLGWHIFTLLMRWLTAWGFYQLLVDIWPARRLPAIMTACLFLVYPVFTMQAIAVTFHQQWLQYALVMLSLIWMVASIRRPARYGWFTAGSVAAALIQLSVTEYFIGLELLRPLILWFLYADEQPPANRLRRTLRAWLPYLVLLAGYVLYRLFLIRLTGDDPYQAETLFAFFSNPISASVWLFKTVFIDLQYTLVSVWANVLRFGETQNVPPFNWFSLAVSLAAAAALAFYLLHLPDPSADEDPPGRRFPGQLLALGILGVLCGPISAWATGRQILSDFHSNRYALPAMLGASLLGMAIFEMARPRRLPGIVLFCALIGLTVGYHLRVENDYRWAWEKQLDYYWQLHWRAPSLQPGTALLSQDEPFENQGLFSTSAALNLLYPTAGQDGYLPYWMYTVYPRYAQDIPDLTHLSYASQFRSLKFTGSAPGTVMLHEDPSTGGCLWVLNALDRENPYLKESTRRMVALSHLDRIQPASGSAQPPARQWFGREPDHGWCYLFETADLAVQQRDWPAAVDLYEQALAQGYALEKSASNSPREWMPFITGLAQAGRWEDSLRLTEESFRQDRRYGAMLCALWDDLLAGAQPGPEGAAAHSSARAALNCSSGE